MFARISYNPESSDNNTGLSYKSFQNILVENLNDFQFSKQFSIYYISTPAGIPTLKFLFSYAGLKNAFDVLRLPSYQRV